MKYDQKLNNQKGVSLYLAISIMAVLLAIVFGLNAILINQIKTTGEIEKSTVAFFAADTGIERVLKEIKNDEANLQPTYNSSAGEFTNSDTSYQVEVTCNPSQTCPGSTSDPNCTSSKYCIKSIGTFRGVKRAIEVRFGGFQPGVTQRFEFYNTGDNIAWSIRGWNMGFAQIFTVGAVGPNEAFKPEFVRLKLVMNGMDLIPFPSGDGIIDDIDLDLVVSIQGVNAATGFPEGIDLCIGSIPAASIAEFPASEEDKWYPINLSDCPILNINTTYALVVTGPGAAWPNFAGDPPDCISWYKHWVGGFYPGGDTVWFGGPTPPGPMWNSDPDTNDYMFEIWGPVSYFPLWKEIAPF